MKKENVGGVPGNILGMLADLCHKLQHGTITPEELGRFLRREEPFLKDYRVKYALTDWENFYRNFFGIEKDFFNLPVPELKEGFNRLIVVVLGLTLNRVYDKCAEKFSCWRYIDDLDKATVKNDRDLSHGSYAILVRNRIEADEELKDLSANDLKEKNILGITLLERLLYELKYFSETGKHLDIRTVTLCLGSRDSDGNVPAVDWHDDKLRVDRHSPVARYDELRVRAAVS